jgi:iron complex outermembrane receptor protein
MKRFGEVVALGCAVAIMSNPAIAQDAPSENPPSDVEAEEIVVTAQRRSENLQRVPISITALGQEALTSIGFKQANDLAGVASGVQVSEVYGKFQPIFSIRGISQSDFNALQSSPVGVYTDEVYIGETFLHGANFFDVERVEVLKGPQGTLYGKNTTGGAVNLISRKPSLTGDFGANFTIGFGNYDAVSVEAGVEGVIIPDRLAIRVAAQYNDDDGYQKNVTFGTRLAETHNFGIRSTILFEPSSGFELIFRHTHSETDQAVVSPIHLGAYPVGPGGRLVDYAGYFRPDSLGEREIESDVRDQRVRIRYDLFSLAATYSASGFDVVSVSSYHTARKRQFFDIDGGGAGVSEANYDNDTKAYSQDLRLVTTADGPFKLIVGGYYGYEKNKSFNSFDLYKSPLLGLRALFEPSSGPVVAQ